MFGVCFALLTGGIAAQGQNIIINEIMYHPSSQDVREEYVELLNAGATTANLSGWKITGGIDFAFPANVTLGPGRLLVVVKDDQVGRKGPVYIHGRPHAEGRRGLPGFQSADGVFGHLDLRIVRTLP